MGTVRRGLEPNKLQDGMNYADGNLIVLSVPWLGLLGFIRTCCLGRWEKTASKRSPPVTCVESGGNPGMPVLEQLLFLLRGRDTGVLSTRIS